MTRRLLQALAAATALLLAAGCGLPTGGDAVRLDRSRMPADLLDGATSGVTVPRRTSARQEPYVYWVDGAALVAVAEPLDCRSDALELARSLLAELAGGPSEEARERGLTSAIPAELNVTLEDLANGIAEVEVDAATAIDAERLPIVIGQIVLTLTSISAVERVAFLSDGELLEVPGREGALTSAPVGIADYRPLVRVEEGLPSGRPSWESRCTPPS